jgi:D-glycero-D-manno-heptose 1,7-bisphosphate phosphatase
MSNKAIFLDRDDTLIEDPGYINSPDQVKLLPGVPRALAELKAMGYKLVLVTNQSAVARGIVTEKTLRNIHTRLEHLLAENNAFLDAIYYCPYHPDGVVAKYRKESDCRKPNPGMLLTAADEMDIDLSQSWMIGNGAHDVEAGVRAGCKTILIDPPSRQHQPRPGDPTPHYRAVNITEAVNVIKKYHRRGDDSTPPAEPPKTQQTQPAAQPPAPLAQGPQPIQQPPQPATEEPLPIHQPSLPLLKDPEPVVKDTEPAAQQAEAISEPPQPPEDSQPSSPVHESPPRRLEAESPPPDEKIHTETTERLLTNIFDQLKSMQRSNMFEKFSLFRYIAGVLQGAVLFCMLITISLLMYPNRQDSSILIALGFAAVLQLMSLTFFMMQGPK